MRRTQMTYEHQAMAKFGEAAVTRSIVARTRIEGSGWGMHATPRPRVNGQTTSVLFLDTEGFESVGKSSVYDDRIFALATVLSSVLIYNLAETVKEADIAKLSFAVELAEEFYGRWVGKPGWGMSGERVKGDGGGEGQACRGRDEVFTPAKLLWLIQRDFLEGKTVQEMVRGALQPVPNPEGDKDVDQVNLIRQSLNLMAANSTAFGLTQRGTKDVDQVNLIRQSLNYMTANSTALGLTQPHLARTRLCELSDDELDPKYVRQRNQLREVLSFLLTIPNPSPCLPSAAPREDTSVRAIRRQPGPQVRASDAISATSPLNAANPSLYSPPVSLPSHQPHLARTRLCELSDDELDPKYVRQRNQLRQLVASLVQPKIVSGRPVTGEEFADLLEKGLSALKRLQQLVAFPVQPKIVSGRPVTGEEFADLLVKLRQLVALLVRPKIVSARSVTVEEFADLLEKTLNALNNWHIPTASSVTLNALNKGHIPTAGSVVDAFNRAVQDKCLALYHQAMRHLLLPADEVVLVAAHRNASGEAVAAFERERFGGKSVEDAVRPLKDELRTALSPPC
ncbi:unnamed protein product [Closterium sp. NIES-65]|nr:unnamed protein product [Closterium sp. NIES-65]